MQGQKEEGEKTRAAVVRSFLPWQTKGFPRLQARVSISITCPATFRGSQITSPQSAYITTCSHCASAFSYTNRTDTGCPAGWQRLQETFLSGPCSLFPLGKSDFWQRECLYIFSTIGLAVSSGKMQSLLNKQSLLPHQITIPQWMSKKNK